MKKDRKNIILQSLASMLEERNLTKITTALLAEKSNITEAALYRHFPSKTKMYEGLIDFIEETIFARVTNIINDEPDATNQCYRILSLTLTFAEKNAGISRLLHGDALTGETERLHQRIAQFFSRLESQLKQILREAELNQGLVINPTPAIAVDLMIALIEGKISQFVRTEFKQRPTQNWQEQWSLVAEKLFSQS